MLMSFTKTAANNSLNRLWIKSLNKHIETSHTVYIYVCFLWFYGGCKSVCVFCAYRSPGMRWSTGQVSDWFGGIKCEMMGGSKQHGHRHITEEPRRERGRERHRYCMNISLTFVNNMQICFFRLWFYKNQKILVGGLLKKNVSAEPVERESLVSAHPLSELLSAGSIFDSMIVPDLLAVSYSYCVSASLSLSLSPPRESLLPVTVSACRQLNQGWGGGPRCHRARWKSHLSGIWILMRWGGAKTDGVDWRSDMPACRWAARLFLVIYSYSYLKILCYEANRGTTECLTHTLRSVMHATIL